MAYNNLHHIERCPNCDKIYYIVTQYKHGFMRCIDYKLGDKIELDNDAADIILDYCYSTDCPYCDAKTNYTVKIKAGILMSTIVLDTTLSENVTYKNPNRHCYTYLPNQDMVRTLLKAEQEKL